VTLLRLNNGKMSHRVSPQIYK
jgi:hypothetical protein